MFIKEQYWEEFINTIPSVEHGDLIGAFHRRIMSSDIDVKKKFAKIWTRWEMITSQLILDKDSLNKVIKYVSQLMK